MKKAKLLLTVAAVLLLTALLASCGNKTPQTGTGFTDIMKNAGFEVLDVTDTTDTDGLASAVIIALGENYQIEFYELVDSETGEAVFYENKEIFDEEHAVKTMSTSVSMGNYNYYAFNAGGEFHLVSRIENTMLYCVADVAYKDEIVDHVKTLGYR